MKVEINKDVLLDALNTNREAHATDYQLALVKYQEKVTKELEKTLERAKRGKKVDPYFLRKFPVPTEYTKSFDSVIDMFEHEVKDTVVLEENDFNRYVRNEWEWSGQFAASTSVYNAR